MIYIVVTSDRKFFKIGYSADKPAARVRQLQTSHPGRLELLGVMDGDQDYERLLHARFKSHRADMNGGEEWFVWNDQLVAELLVDAVPAKPWVLAEEATWSRRIITPAIARQWLEDYRFEGQRDTWKEHIAFLASEMSGGDFLPTEFIVLAHNGRTTSLLNGQHRLKAIIQCNRAQVEYVIDFEVPDENDKSEIYSACDVHRARHFAQLINLYRLEEATGLSKEWINKLHSAIEFIGGGFRSNTKRKQNHPAHAALVREFSDAAHRYETRTRGADKEVVRALKRRAIFSVGLVLYRHVPIEELARVDEFWSKVASGLAQDKGDPCLQLHKHLIYTKMPSGAANKTQGKTESAATQARWVAKCWNLYYERKTCERVSPDSEDVPLKLLGISGFNRERIDATAAGLVTQALLIEEVA